jgi:hypothetical protein
VNLRALVVSVGRATGLLLLLDDPEIRQIAGFGPPEVLLDASPTIVLPPRFMNKTKRV